MKKPWLFRLYRGLYGIMISHYKDPYKPTSIMKSNKVFFFVAHVNLGLLRVLPQLGFLWKTKVFLDLFFLFFSHFTMVNHHSSPPFVRIVLDFLLLLHRLANKQIQANTIPSRK